MLSQPPGILRGWGIMPQLPAKELTTQILPPRLRMKSSTAPPVDSPLHAA